MTLYNRHKVEKETHINPRTMQVNVL